MARRSSGRRTDYTWFGVSDIVVAQDLAIANATLGGESIAFGTAGTVMRLRGQVAVLLNAAAVAESAVIAVGIIRATDEAAAAGVASLPHPDSDPDAEWIWHSYLSIHSGQEAAIVNDFLMDRKEIDSKAMRRVKQNEQLVLVSEVAHSEDQTGLYDLLYGFRMLFGT